MFSNKRENRKKKKNYTILFEAFSVVSEFRQELFT